MERRETPVRERPGRRREQHPEGPAVSPASAGRRGVCAAGGALGFRGSACAPWARRSPLSPPALWDVSQQNTESPLGDCKNVPVVERNVVI